MMQDAKRTPNNEKRGQQKIELWPTRASQISAPGAYAMLCTYCTMHQRAIRQADRPTSNLCQPAQMYLQPCAWRHRANLLLQLTMAHKVPDLADIDDGVMMLCRDVPSLVHLDDGVLMVGR